MRNNRMAMTLVLMLMSLCQLELAASPAGKPVSLIPSFWSPNTTGCTPLNANFTDMSAFDAGDPIVAWKWYFGDGDSSTLQNPFHIYTSASAFNVTLMLTTQSGLRDTLYKPAFITTTAGLSLNLGGDTSICSTDLLTLDAGNAGAIYLWNTGETSQTIEAFSSGSYSVTVTRSGCEIADTVNVTITPALLPKFGWTTLSNCLPQMIQFSDSSITCGVTITDYYWDFGDGTFDNTAEPMHTYGANGSYVVKLRITDNLGNSLTRTKTLVVNTETPVVNLGADTTVCDGTILTLDAGAQPGSSYIWSTGESTQTIQVDATDDYWVQVYNASCATTASIHVTVKPQLFPNFSFVQTGTCLPVSVQFSDLSQTCNTSIVFYKWDFGDGNTSNAQNPLHTYTVAGSYNIKLTVRDNTGFQITRSKTLNLNINSPFVNLGNDTTICYGNTLTLNGPAGVDSYLWSDGSTGQSMVVTDFGPYWLQVTKNGCSGWDTINVSTGFPIMPQVAADITSQCLPVNVNFGDSSKVVCGNSSIVYWKWDFGDGSTSFAQHPSHIYTDSGLYTVRLTIRNSQGISITKNRQVQIQTTGPVVDLGKDLTICIGATAVLDAGNEGAVFAWEPAELVSNPNIGTPLVFPRETMTFKATVTQCGITSSDSIIIYIDSAGKPNISLHDGGVLASSPAISYQWYLEGEKVPNAKSRNWKPARAGNYQVEVSNAKGCTNMSDKYFFLPDGGKPLPGSKVKVKISPNPSRGLISILLSKAPDKPVKVHIYDCFGRHAYEGKITNNVNNINLSHLKKGHYFVLLYLNDQRVLIPIQLL
ncbi:MAG: PKD domain-containing protein [Gemmatimonadaceae bacterium]|nr:PKD domain-containing protein [Chitinophagaceae bacterium]